MEGSTIDVATIIIGAEGAFISLLIGIVGYFHVVNTKNQNNRMNKHERDMSEMSKFIMAQQEQIKLLAQKIEDTINLVDNNQKNDQERMKFMQDLILKDMPLTELSHDKQGYTLVAKTIILEQACGYVCKPRYWYGGDAVFFRIRTLLEVHCGRRDHCGHACNQVV